MAEDTITREQAQEILAEMREMKQQMAAMLRQQKVVQSFLSALTEAQDFGKTMREIENVAKDITNADKATFYCCDNAENKFFVENNENREYSLENDSTENIMLSAMRNNAAKWESDKDWKVFKTDDTNVYIPIISNDNQILGIVEAVKESGFDKNDDFDLFKPNSEIINTIDLALKKEVIHQDSITDELTGVKIRKGLNEYLKNTLCPILNDGKPMNILMCDIDHFKDVNDTYGHDGGDVVLKNVAEILKDETRSGADSVFRVGGEEFLCFFGGEADKAYEKAENIRKTVEAANNSVLKDGKPVDVKVTISMGLYQLDPSIGMQFTKENAKEMFKSELKHADDLLYAAKHGGRNQIKTTPPIYDSYLVSKSAEVIGVNSIAEQAMSEIKNCVALGDKDSIIEAAESMGVDTYKSNSLRADFDNRGRNIQDIDNGKIGNVSYMDIKPQYRAYLSDIPERQIQNLIPKLEEKGIKFSGIRNKHGDYTLTVNKYDVKNVKAMLYESGREQYSRQNTYKSPEPKKEPKFYNKEAYNDIQNKTYLQTDAKTAYAISQEAQRDGVNFSAKFDGEKSAVTVDGKKDLSFVNKIKSIKEWADKVSIKAAPIKQRQLEEQNKSYNGDAR